jgi:hypothetical protein
VNFNVLLSKYTVHRLVKINKKKKTLIPKISLSYIGTVIIAAVERLKRLKGMTNKSDTNMDKRY